MSDQLEDLKNQWRNAKGHKEGQPIDINQLIVLSKKKMKRAVNMHIENIVILTVTLLGILAFFKYVAPFRELVSQIGVALMVGGLIVRIAIELYSILKSSKVSLGHSAIDYNDSSMTFYRFRKMIHGPVLTVILVAYTVGFYMLTPEFSQYLSIPMIVLIDASYLLGALIVGYSIRTGIRKEMNHLQELLELQNEIIKDRSRD